MSSTGTLVTSTGDSCDAQGQRMAVGDASASTASGNNPSATANCFLMMGSSFPLAFQFLEYSWWFPDASLHICFSLWQKCFALVFLGPFPFLSTTWKLHYHLLKKLSLFTLLDLVSLFFLKHPIFAFHRAYHTLHRNVSLAFFFVLSLIMNIAANKIITSTLVNFSGDNNDLLLSLTKKSGELGTMTATC